MAKLSSVSNHLLLLSLACALILIGGCRNSGPSTTEIEHDSGPSTMEIGSEIAGPVLKWKVKRGEGIYSSLTIANGIVYVTTGFDLYALEATTGAVKWKWVPLSSPLSGPTVANDTIYVGASSVLAYALDAQTGSEKWRQLLSNAPSEGVSNPIAADGLVYFGTGWSDWSCCENRGSGGSISALDGETGGLVWQVDTKGSYGSGGVPSTTFGVGNGMLYFGAEYGPDVDEKQLYVLDAKTGKQVWKVASDPTVPFVTPDGTLYIALERELLSLDGKTGQERWRWKLHSGKERLSHPAVVEDIVYVIGNQKRDWCWHGPCSRPKYHTDTLYALDTTTGKERWKHDLDGGYYGIRDIALFQQYLCFGVADFSGDTELWYLRAVERNNGKLWWEFEIDGDILGLPAAIDDTIYFVTDKGTVYALQLP